MPPTPVPPPPAPPWPPWPPPDEELDAVELLLEEEDDEPLLEPVSTSLEQAAPEAITVKPIKTAAPVRATLPSAFRRRAPQCGQWVSAILTWQAHSGQATRGGL